MAQQTQVEAPPTLAARLVPAQFSWAWLGVAPFFIFALDVPDPADGLS